ncbi:MAG: family 16 glycoside hydrolase [Saprospiraceae bacterium]
MKNCLWLFLLINLTWSCSQDVAIETAEKEEAGLPPFLPMNEVSLDQLDFWEVSGENWRIVGGVVADFQKEWDLATEEGSGILVNMVPDEGKRDVPGKGSHLISKLEHGDLELEFEVLVPKGSNSGIYFQNRYELQIRDTQGDDDLTPDDMGGIYYRSGSDGKNVEGSAPSINAARLAGLWQKFKVMFRAPRFDESGEKIKDAELEYVYLNGALIQEHVSLSGPTVEASSEEEVALAPFRIQGDHGPVAFRNIKYKAFDLNKVVGLSELTYKLYEGKFDYIPDFDTLSVVDSGTVVDFSNLTELAGYNDGVNLVFEGVLEIPTSGTYLFETIIDDGGDLYIDGNLIVPNEGDPGYGLERATVDLTAGSHKVRQTFYQEVWSAYLIINVEGPGVEKHAIPFVESSVEEEKRPKRKLAIEVKDRPELIRAFVNHQGEKRTHILSIGSPEGIHYSFDTRNDQLLNVWRGDFADVSKMWINRGEEQLLQPMGAVLELEESDLAFHPLGYDLSAEGYPVYRYQLGTAIISDKSEPENRMLKRTLSSEQGEVELPIAIGQEIVPVSGGWYAVDQLYFVKMDSGEGTLSKDGSKLMVRIKAGESISYLINW